MPSGLFGGLFFFYEAVAVGLEQFDQFVDLAAEYLAFVGITDSKALMVKFDDLCRAENVSAVFYGLFRGCEGDVLHELEASGMVYQRISGDTGGVMICP